MLSATLFICRYCSLHSSSISIPISSHMIRTRDAVGWIDGSSGESDIDRISSAAGLSTSAFSAFFILFVGTGDRFLSPKTFVQPGSCIRFSITICL